ncbi:PIG-L family deacetylase [Xylanimonas ulmi]|uniref:N-acetyl-1-D-myo-inositol-2-amino-2-deoxy-alpha-D-glucopyranoside deacetylase n=1 Tax=Xylanimonas ulmi TaxID=228973 RepID=A0A4Q7M373_9MICO|nr:PIG-L family deacetylase [Xylanibacterium ulmi]RZS61771.1 N-acetyl-1-D-myo-inositol-2-amino-2-deoxy-alpha-D-glucopyranoside deacetylase [Xylanibacterium ulmi]
MTALEAPAGGAGWPALPGGLVAVHAHPDDETLSTGALIASFAAAGLPVTVVTCTRGERGEVIALPGTTSAGLAALEGDGPALAAHRSGELAAALLALGGGRPGAVRHVFLDELPPSASSDDGGAGARFEDSGMVWLAPGVAGGDPKAVGGFVRVPLDDAAARLAALVRRLRPSVVATYEPGGGYGHPDHVRAHDVTVRALALAADEVRRPALWRRVEPVSVVLGHRAALAADPAVRALADRAGLSLPAADDPLPAVARVDEALAGAAASGDLATVEVRPVLDRVLAAMAAHATQIQHAQAHDAAQAHRATLREGGVADPLGFYALSNGVLAAVGARETYLVARDAQVTSVGSAR